MTLDVIKADWPLQSKVVALTTTRSGGVSAACYRDFNLALHVGDQATNVKKNRSILQHEISLPDEPKWLQQVHSTTVVTADDIQSDQAIADAAFTSRSDIVCAVLTADCLPIVLSDKHANCIGVAHAGWRGLLNGIVQKTVLSMSAIAKPDYAWLGPAIGPQAFEVGVDVYQPFMQQDSSFQRAFKPINNSKWYFDIYQAASIVLRSVGIKEVYGGGHCTYSEDTRFFSYRRDVNTGRMATLIWRK